MTRAERIQKLAHAIDEYRGSYVPNSDPRKWIRHPKPAAKERILKWLAALGVKKTDDALVAIEGFYDKPAMRTWLVELEKVDHGK